MPDNEAVLNLLRSALPSERSKAAEALLLRTTAGHRQAIANALERESVPAIQRLLALALKRSQDQREDQNSPARAEADAGLGDTMNPAPNELLDEIARLIRHETEPVIGWLRRSAAHELGEQYQLSDTCRNIELLRNRLRGLETLAAAHRLPAWEMASLSQIINDARPQEMRPPLSASIEPESDLISTDIGLLTIIVANALSNAADAAKDLGPEAIWVDSRVTDSNFWLSITNRFRGDSFDFEHLAHTGTSTKASHRGLGLSAMRLAASRLGYKLSLSAEGGSVFFSVRGPRNGG